MNNVFGLLMRLSQLHLLRMRLSNENLMFSDFLCQTRSLAEMWIVPKYLAAENPLIAGFPSRFVRSE